MKNVMLLNGVKLFLVLVLALGVGFSCKSGKKVDETAPEAELSSTDAEESTGEEESPAEVAVEGTNELQKVHFDYDRYNIRSDAVKVLARNAKYLKANPDVWIQVEGHCDDRGSAEYNLALGEKRANSARNYLVNMGIDATRISIISYGEEKPIESEEDEHSWSMNRRAEFVIVSRGN